MWLRCIARWTFAGKEILSVATDTKRISKKYRIGVIANQSLGTVKKIMEAFLKSKCREDEVPAFLKGRRKYNTS
ncbi:MAG: hypothetical protein K2K70_02355 [Lachnospiraceae bacterium]|nr:hypothetical protein [Lachnospiraceae bacterium]